MTAQAKMMALSEAGGRRTGLKGEEATEETIWEDRETTVSFTAWTACIALKAPRRHNECPPATTKKKRARGDEPARRCVPIPREGRRDRFLRVRGETGLVNRAKVVPASNSSSNNRPPEGARAR